MCIQTLFIYIRVHGRISLHFKSSMQDFGFVILSVDIQFSYYFFICIPLWKKMHVPYLILNRDI